MKRILSMFCLAAVALWGDTLRLKDGGTVTGIVRNMDDGKVTVDVGGQSRSIDLLQVLGIVFDTPHAEDVPSVDEVPVREFTRVADRVVKAQKESKRTWDVIKSRWSTRKSVEPNHAQQWSADRERFAAPFSDYRKSIHQMYLDLAAHVDNYNTMARDAEKLYVGVKGPFNIGSPLIRDSERDRPLKDFIPGHWYDQIYYDAYRKGFNDAVEFQALTPR
jgi:acylphosphatase